MKYILLSFIIFLFGFFNLSKTIFGFFDYLFTPLQFGLQKTALNIKDATLFYAHLRGIRRENVRLLEDKIMLESRVMELKRLEEENVFLRSQAGIKPEIDLKLNIVLANVMGNPTDLSSATIIIDKGAQHKISIGDTVVIGQFLVGKVKSVYGTKSEVELIVSPKSSVTVYNLDNVKKSEAIAQGNHGLSVSVEKILQSEVINIGDIYATSGKDAVYPPGLYVGKVLEIHADPSQPLKSASLQTILDISRLDKVLVLIQK